MHFEIGKGKLEQWKSAGLFGDISVKALKRGDRGQAVVQLQWKLTQSGARLKLDGDFGESTESAVRQFQRRYNLGVDGVVGAKTRKALDLS